MLGLGVGQGKAWQDDFVWLGQRRRALELEEVTVAYLGSKASSAPQYRPPLGFLKLLDSSSVFHAGTGNNNPVVAQMIWLFFTIQGILFSVLWELKRQRQKPLHLWKNEVME